VGEPARALLIGSLVLVGVATLVGLVLLWPAHDPRPSAEADQFAAPGVTFPHGSVVSVQRPCRSDEVDPAVAGCGSARVRVTEGSSKGQVVSVPLPPEVIRAGLGRGDGVELIRTPASKTGPAGWSYFGTSRLGTIWLLVGLFVLVVALVARLRGLLAVVGLAFGALVLVKFMLPALLTGESGLGVALTGSAAIMFVVLYLAHGLSLRTSAALAGTLAGVGMTALIGSFSVASAHLTGISDETGAILSSFAGQVSFQGLLTCAVIVAGLGVLNDVTITQASAVWELRAASETITPRELFASAMRIGRDHIASTIYTIVFAYAGSALAVLLLLYVYDRPLVDLLSTESIAEEVLRTLASAIGLVLAVPATTAIAVACVSPRRQVRRSRDRLRI
jgi:uncharacterized membrane protein